MQQAEHTDIGPGASPARPADPSLASLSIRHLQMPPGLTCALEARGIVRIGDLEAAKAAGHDCGFVAKTGPYLERLARAGGDWPRYWQLCRDRFHYLHATSPELRALPPALRDMPLGRGNFGNAGARLARTGIATVGELSDALAAGISEVHGLGRRKTQALFGTLSELVALLRSETAAGGFGDLVSGQIRASQARGPVAGHPSHRSVLARLPLQVLGLGLGRVGDDLGAIGIDSVGALVAALAGGAVLPAGIGPLRISNIRHAIALAGRHISAEGVFDHEGYCRSRGIRLLPDLSAASSDADLLKRIPEILRETVEAWKDPLFSRVLQDRIMRPVEARLPLSSIGAEFGLSRERIRQREEGLVALLARLLHQGEDARGAVVLRERMREVLARVVAITLDDGGRVNFHLMAHRLSEAFDVPPDQILPMVPALFRIIRGELPIRKDTGELTSGDITAIEAMPAIRDLPVSVLQVGRLIGEVEEAGYARLGEVIDAAKSGRISRKDCAAMRRAIDEIRSIAAFVSKCGVCAATDSAGRFDLAAWAAFRDVPVLPAETETDASGFLASLRPAVETIAERALNMSNARGILRLRIFPARSERLTMQACSERIGGVPTRIKSDETRLLRYLRATLERGSDALAHAHLRPAFVRYWADIFEIAGQCENDGELIVSQLIARWRVDEAQVTQEFPLIMAVLTGYPYGRLTRQAA